MARQDFGADQEFQKVAVQKVGLTGYTALHAVPNEKGIWYNWAHTNPKIVGLDMSTLKGPMGQNFDGFWKVFSSGKDGKESRGYYTWQERTDLSERNTWCVLCQRNPYYVAATTYLDEFTKPVKIWKAGMRSPKAREYGLHDCGRHLLLVGFVVLFYGQRIDSRIRSLTDVAERISVGDMDAEISIKSKDESEIWRKPLTECRRASAFHRKAATSALIISAATRKTTNITRP
jgi:hypothetical protein